jgi:hypothetical protein
MQPINGLLGPAQHILLTGCGGGYDVFGAVPLAIELLDAGRDVVLGNHSFCYLNGLDGALQQPDCPNLYRVPASAATEEAYCPEAWLARWFAEEHGRELTIWGFDKTGVQPLRRALQSIVDRHAIDAIVLIDGGIDAVLRGDETSLGTPAEDLAFLAATATLDVPRQALACVGFGAEQRDGICHEQVLGRIAELTRSNGFLGTAALLPQTRSGQRYRAAVDYTFAHQQAKKRSHVHEVVSAAMAGEYGSRGPHTWLSPLLALYWFFDLAMVAQTHLFLDQLNDTEDIWQVSARIEAFRKSLSVRERSAIPI